MLAPLSPVIVYGYVYTLIDVYKHCGWFCAVVVLSAYPAHFRTVYVRFRTWNHKRRIAKALKQAKHAVDAQYTANNEGSW